MMIFIASIVGFGLGFIVGAGVAARITRDAYEKLIDGESECP